MCLGGPNHCRVGRAGSQFYLSSCDRRLCMQLLVVRPCHLFMFIMVASYSSSGGDAESNALIVSFVHARTHFLNTHTKKKFALVTRVGSS
jgi:hypothetical protein